MMQSVACLRACCCGFDLILLHGLHGDVITLTHNLTASVYSAGSLQNPVPAPTDVLNSRYKHSVSLKVNYYTKTTTYCINSSISLPPSVTGALTPQTPSINVTGHGIRCFYPVMRETTIDGRPIPCTWDSISGFTPYSECDVYMRTGVGIFLYAWS